MRKGLLFLCAIFFLFSCSDEEVKPVKTKPVGRKPVVKVSPTKKKKVAVVKEIKLEELKPLSKEEIQKLIAGFEKDFYAKLKKPKLNKDITLRLMVGGSMEGKVSEIQENSLIFCPKVGNSYGKVELHYSRLRLKDIKRYFPGMYARKYANQKLDAYMENREKEFEAKQKARLMAQAVHSQSKPQVVNKVITLGHFDGYILTTSVTPSHCELLLKEMSLYIKRQNRIIGTAIALKMHIKRQGSAYVLYLEPSKSIAREKKATLKALYSGVKDFYVRRCLVNGIARTSRAFICVSYNGKKLIASKLDNAEELEIF